MNRDPRVSVCLDKHHGVLQHAYSNNFNLDHVSMLQANTPILEPANSRWCTCHDGSISWNRCSLRHMAQDLTNIEHKLCWTFCMLPLFPVHPGRQCCLTAVRRFEFFGGEESWPHRCELVKSFGKEELATGVGRMLELAAREIIASSVA